MQGGGVLSCPTATTSTCASTAASHSAPTAPAVRVTLRADLAVPNPKAVVRISSLIPEGVSALADTRRARQIGDS